MKIFLLLLLTLNLSVVSSTFAKTKKGVTVDVSLSPAGSFTLKSKKVKGVLEKTPRGFIGKKLSIKVKSLKSGIDLRDEHTQKKMGEKKFPKIIVTEIKASQGKGSAVITIKGIKKPLKFKYTVDESMAVIDFSLSIKKFKITDVKYMGVGAKDRVQIKAIVPIK